MYFTIPGAQKKRKRVADSHGPKKRIATGKQLSKPSGTRKGPAKSAAAPASKKRVERDESISGSDVDTDEGGDDLARDADSNAPSDEDEDEDEDGEEGEDQTAAARRLRLAERYLEKTRQEVEEGGFDAEEIDRDLIAERLQEDAAESKGKVYRKLAAKLDPAAATSCDFRWNSETITSVAVCASFLYTASKDGYLTKWKIQDLPKNQWPQTTRRKSKKPPAPPKKRPEKICCRRADKRMAGERGYNGHTGAILAVRASQDGKYVVSGGADRRVVVSNAETLEPIRTFSQHRDAVTGLAFRRGTNQVYSCSSDRTVRVWSLDELAYVETLFGHQDSIVDIDALAQDRCISVGSRDRTARYWKVPEETQLVFHGGGAASSGTEKKAAQSALPPGIGPESLAREGSMDRCAMLDDEMFVTGGDSGALALWSIRRKKPLFVLPRAHGIEPPLAPAQVSADENPDPAVVPPPQPRWITALRAVPYTDTFLSGSWDGCVRIWRLSEDKKKFEAAGVLGSEQASARDQNQRQQVKPNGVIPNGINGINGASSSSSHASSSSKNTSKKKKEVHWGDVPSSGMAMTIKGVVNDIAVFERGDRGKDGLCVIVATGKEMRLGRWKVLKDGGRCGVVVFEVPRLQKAAGMPNGGGHGDDASDGEDE